MRNLTTLMFSGKFQKAHTFVSWDENPIHDILIVFTAFAIGESQDPRYWQSRPKEAADVEERFSAWLGHVAPLRREMIHFAATTAARPRHLSIYSRNTFLAHSIESDIRNKRSTAEHILHEAENITGRSEVEKAVPVSSIPPTLFTTEIFPYEVVGDLDGGTLHDRILKILNATEYDDWVAELPHHFEILSNDEIIQKYPRDYSNGEFRDINIYYVGYNRHLSSIISEFTAVRLAQYYILKYPMRVLSCPAEIEFEALRNDLDVYGSKGDIPTDFNEMVEDIIESSTEELLLDNNNRIDLFHTAINEKINYIYAIQALFQTQADMTLVYKTPNFSNIDPLNFDILNYETEYASAFIDCLDYFRIKYVYPTHLELFFDEIEIEISVDDLNSALDLIMSNETIKYANFTAPDDFVKECEEAILLAHFRIFGPDQFFDSYEPLSNSSTSLLNFKEFYIGWIKAQPFLMQRKDSDAIRVRDFLTEVAKTKATETFLLKRGGQLCKWFVHRCFLRQNSEHESCSEFKSLNQNEQEFYHILIHTSYFRDVCVIYYQRPHLFKVTRKEMLNDTQLDNVKIDARETATSVVEQLREEEMDSDTDLYDPELQLNTESENSPMGAIDFDYTPYLRRSKRSPKQNRAGSRGKKRGRNRGRRNRKNQQANNRSNNFNSARTRTYGQSGLTVQTHAHTGLQPFPTPKAKIHGKDRFQNSNLNANPGSRKQKKKKNRKNRCKRSLDGQDECNLGEFRSLPSVYNRNIRTRRGQPEEASVDTSQTRTSEQASRFESSTLMDGASAVNVKTLGADTRKFAVDTEASTMVSSLRASNPALSPARIDPQKVTTEIQKVEAHRDWVSTGAIPKDPFYKHQGASVSQGGASALYSRPASFNGNSNPNSLYETMSDFGGYKADSVFSPEALRKKGFERKGSWRQDPNDGSNIFTPSENFRASTPKLTPNTLTVPKHGTAKIPSLSRSSSRTSLSGDVPDGATGRTSFSKSSSKSSRDSQYETIDSSSQYDNVPEQIGYRPPTPPRRPTPAPRIMISPPNAPLPPKPPKFDKNGNIMSTSDKNWKKGKRAGLSGVTLVMMAQMGIDAAYTVKTFDNDAYTSERDYIENKRQFEINNVYQNLTFAQSERRRKASDVNDKIIALAKYLTTSKRINNVVWNKTLTDHKISKTPLEVMIRTLLKHIDHETAAVAKKTPENWMKASHNVSVEDRIKQKNFQNTMNQAKGNAKRIEDLLKEIEFLKHEFEKRDNMQNNSPVPTTTKPLQLYNTSYLSDTMNLESLMMKIIQVVEKKENKPVRKIYYSLLGIDHEIRHDFLSIKNEPLKSKWKEEFTKEFVNIYSTCTLVQVCKQHLKDYFSRLYIHAMTANERQAYSSYVAVWTQVMDIGKGKYQNLLREIQTFAREKPLSEVNQAKNFYAHIYYSLDQSNSNEELRRNLLRFIEVILADFEIYKEYMSEFYA